MKLMSLVNWIFHIFYDFRFVQGIYTKLLKSVTVKRTIMSISDIIYTLLKHLICFATYKLQTKQVRKWSNLVRKCRLTATNLCSLQPVWSAKPERVLMGCLQRQFDIFIKRGKLRVIFTVWIPLGRKSCRLVLHGVM